MPQYTRKPKEWFTVNEQARKNFSESSIRELMLSMEEHGQLQPVGAKADGTLIWGERRLRAYLVSKKLTELHVVVCEEGMTEAKFRILQATENFLREDLSGYEKHLACVELLAVNPSWKAKDVAEHLHVDPSTITRLLSPSNCIPAVQDAFRSGAIGVSDCYAISKCDQKEQHEMLAAKLGGASRDALERHGRRTRNAQRETVKLSRINVPISGAAVSISGADLSMSSVVELLTELLKEAKKAADQYDVRTWQAMLRDKAKVAS